MKLKPNAVNSLIIIILLFILGLLTSIIVETALERNIPVDCRIDAIHPPKYSLTGSLWEKPKVILQCGSKTYVQDVNLDFWRSYREDGGRAVLELECYLVVRRTPLAVIGLIQKEALRCLWTKGNK